MASNETLMFASMSFSGAEEKEIIEALWEKKSKAISIVVDQFEFQCKKSFSLR